MNKLKPGENEHEAGRVSLSSSSVPTTESFEITMSREGKSLTLIVIWISFIEFILKNHISQSKRQIGKKNLPVNTTGMANSHLMRWK